MPVSRILKRASALVADGSKHIGSCYYVGDRIVVTCNHVANKFQPGEDIEIWFDATAQARRGKLLRWSVACDVALLELGSAPDDIDPLKLDAAPLNADVWQSYAFPGFARERPIVLEGQVDDLESFPFGVRAIQLYSQRLHDQSREGVGGISGAPVMCNDRVIGHFSRVLGAAGEGPQAKLGMLYAVPAEAVHHLLVSKKDGHIDDLCAPRAVRGLADDDPILARLYAAIVDGREPLASLRSRFFNAQAMKVTIAGAVMFAAEQLIARGQPAEALEMLTLIEDERERAQQLRALAFSLQGRDEQASELLNMLNPTPESGGIRGGALKRRWLATQERPWLQSSYEVYHASFLKNPDDVEAHYPGVNAATVALLLGNDEQSAALADQVQAALSNVPQEKWTIWHTASRAELQLLRGELDQARADYTLAAASTAKRNIAAMRRQARLILERQGKPKNLLDDAFPSLGIVYLEPSGDVGAEEQASVVALIQACAKARRLAVGYCSGLNHGAAAFVDALSQAGLSVSAVLPDQTYAAIVGARSLYLSDQPAASAAVSAPCEAAALEAARDMASLLDESVLLLRVGRDAAGAPTLVAIES